MRADPPLEAEALGAIALADVQAARLRMAGLAVRTPLVRLRLEARDDIWLKLETLQPVGSFKVRCAANALRRRADQGVRGVSTASAGNFAQGLAYAGGRLGVPVTAYVPETAARSKIEAMERLGATINRIPFAQWWSMLAEPADDPGFIHPAADADVLAGNGVIALEVLEDLPEVRTILAPYGGGGLCTGIAAGAKAAGSAARVVACETEAGAPLRAAFAAGEPATAAFDPTTFVTGMGGPTVLSRIWPLARSLIADTALVSLDQTADALRLMVERNHVVAEGAGAGPVAAALAGDFDGPTVCVVSGGHLDVNHLVAILQGRTP